MRSCSRDDVAGVLRGRRVAVVGSGPGVLDNEPGLVDSFDVVVRVNNYKTSAAAGWRTDVFYSFFGTSIRKTRDELVADGVRLCICKCPDAKFMESEWHDRNRKPHGVDFRYIYRDRADWWFCPTYVPAVCEFLRVFNLLGGRVPTTGFSALQLVLEHEPAEVFMTGFDFFESGVHNVNEAWRAGRADDPIGHAPARERAWVAAHRRGITMDRRLNEILEGEADAVLDA